MNPQQPQNVTPLPAPQQGDGGLSTMIPYKNMPALLSYYFGVFGLIPFLGVPLSIAALILGFIGLNKNKIHPETKGKAHAITGIVLGSVEMVVLLVFIVLLIVAE